MIPPEEEIVLPARWLLVGLLLILILVMILMLARPVRGPRDPVALLPTPTGPATPTVAPTLTPTPMIAPTVVVVCGLPQTSLPRPAGANRRGVHWCPATRHTTASTDRLVAAARDLQLKWAVVVFGLDSWNFQDPYAGEDAHLIRALQAAGIMPIVRLDGQVGADDLPAFQRQVQALSKLGVDYFQIGNEPNRADENGGRQPDPAAYVRWWLPRARVVVQNGGYPGLGALDPGSEYGDYAFLRTTLTRLRDGEACGVLSRTWLSTHLYLLGPLNANYVASEGGFARHRAYDAITRGVLGYGLLQIATEAGVSSLRQDWQGDPEGVAQRQSEQLAQAYQTLSSVPAYFLAFNPWLLANLFCDSVGNPTFEYSVFLDRNSAARPVVAQVR